ncbi:guanylate kinase [Nitrosomonas cryotolerans]|uniref:Guanylate kinase n=1 Tax=Nitrosomonas cryotolerans ATCC 49181 TaxID=1131553 RepID=A0A1N6JC10_9PROT|nr:guanylate kinase [Nitrosomonas cryotolerans]SFP48452.1 guanylate kinase [Nitrosomonas cryotolerans]SIO41767.1 guanylate kinase [Nitrosomonas cryotolerans ATCC 49181]
MTTIAGNLFIISAPSGAGKTSLVKALLKNDLNLNLSISHTSRPPRAGEVNGRDYHFISKDTFRQMLQQGEFLESAQVYGNFYGTSKKWINETMASGHDILLEIDCQGAQQVRRTFHQVVGIFILPPSADTLATRLMARGQDSPEVMQKRLAAVCEEVTHIHEFDYVIINKNLEEAVSDLVCIVRAERLKKARQLVNHHRLIAQLE